MTGFPLKWIVDRAKKLSEPLNRKLSIILLRFARYLVFLYYLCVQNAVIK